jgi:hypothetical protein
MDASLGNGLEIAWAWGIKNKNPGPIYKLKKF